MRRMITAGIAISMLLFSQIAFASTPVSYQEPALVAEKWKIEILKLFRDSAKIDLKADWFNDWLKDNPPKKGEQFFTVRIRITNDGDAAGDPTADLNFSVVSDTEFEYDGRSSCGIVPGQFLSPQVDAGDSIETNICWVVQNKHVASLQLIVSERGSPDSDAVSFALRRPPAAEPESGPPVETPKLRIANAGENADPFKFVAEFAAGEYEVDEYCSDTSMQIYVFEVGDDPNNMVLVTHPVSRSRLNEPSTVAVIPRDDEFLVEVWCDGGWAVAFEQR